MTRPGTLLGRLTRSTRVQRALAVTAGAALVTLVLTVPGNGAEASASHAPAASEHLHPAKPAAQQRRAASDGAFSDTKTITRTFLDSTGASTVDGSYDVTVDANKTQDLRGRQRIRISWSGARPSAGRASNPYGENGLQQEYPVVIMQCRGTDDPSLPADQQVSQSTCFTNSVAERSQILRSSGDAIWTRDQYASDADTQRLSGIDPFPSNDDCPGADTNPYYTHLTPFVSAAGKVYQACSSSKMPPEAAVGAAYPPAEIAAFTDLDGNGSVQFEVRSETENESLGCSDTVACSIEVIPIVGLSCAAPATTKLTAADKSCRKEGLFQPGSSNFTNDGVDAAVSPALWWSASNWRNRFSIPITFGPPPDTCDLLDPRPPTGFFGSELLAQAALQWSPAYCLSKKRFKFQLNQMPDQQGFDLMEGGDAPAAVVSSEHDNTGDDPVGYAPTAVTGFSIGYVMDKPDNAGEYTQLKLTPWLIAKLMTESYLGSDLGRGHPGMSGNPLSIMSDPEFKALNPGLSTNDQEAAATLLLLSNPSDVIEQLTEYIAQDADAMAFIHGKPDPWGMVVNPAYKDLTVPTTEWPLLDTYIPDTNNTCRQQNPSVYFSQLAAPVSTLRIIANALLDAWPNVQTKCEYDPSTTTYKIGRIDRQSFGSRFMMGVVSLGDAARYGLRNAALQTTPGTFVTPDDTSLGTAVKIMKQTGGSRGPYVLSQADVAKTAGAYPGTMVVYTASKLRDADQAEADNVAQFIRISTTEGQQLGSGNGELPDGFLPISKTGPTAKLYTTAQDVADAVQAQTPLPTSPPTSSSPSTSPSTPDPTDTTSSSAPVDTTTTPAPTDTSSAPVTSSGPTAPAPILSTDPVTGDVTTVPAAPTDGSTPSTQATDSASAAVTSPAAPVTEDTTPVAATQSVKGGAFGRVLVWLLVAGLLGALYSAGSRFFVRVPKGGK